MSNSNLNVLKRNLNLEDRAFVFLAMLISYLAIQAGLFYKIIYGAFIGCGEQISDAINKNWKMDDYLSRKLGAFGWVTSIFESVATLV